MKKINKNEHGFSYIEIVLVLVVVGVIGATGWYVWNIKKTTDYSYKNAATAEDLMKLSAKSNAKSTPLSPQTTSTPTSSSGSSSPKTNSSNAVVKPQTQSNPTPAPTSTVNTTNCLPSNPSVYATYFINMTNSQYLQSNSYVPTTKLFAALQFAGLIDTVNTKQYVVLAMSDSQWNSFTPSQLNWMNASPANMRAVLGWQVVTSCISWDGVNPVKDMSMGAQKIVNTLNGQVTYTHGTPGKFGAGSVGIWDWFTSNGSVTIAGFVNTNAIP